MEESRPSCMTVKYDYTEEKNKIITGA